MNRTDQDPIYTYPLLKFSREIPSGTEAFAARTQLRLAEEELHQLDLDLQLIHAKRAHIIDRIDRCRSVIAPIKKLPTELVREILGHCVPLRLYLPSEKGTRDPRLQITQVCSSWRAIAFGIHELWSVHLILSRYLGRLIHLVRAWFNQCVGPRLSLHTSSIQTTDVVRAGSNLVIKKLVIPYSNRFRSLRLVVNSELWDLVRILPFDNLVALGVIHQRGTNNTQLGKLISTPRLQSLQLRFGKPQFFPKFSWAKLKQLTLHGALWDSNDANAIMKILEECASLEACMLHIFQLAQVPLLRNTPLCLSHLTSLDMDIFPEEFSLVSVFQLPCLTSFKLMSFPTNFPGFISFIRSIARSLRRFKIPYATGEKIIHIDESFLLEIPFITHLTLGRGHILAPTVLAKIATRELLPDLERFKFSVDVGTYLPEIILVELPPSDPRAKIKQLWKSDRRILNMDDCRGYWGNTVPSWLDSLWSRGLIVKLIPF
jgi:hypothetical protein